VCRVERMQVRGEPADRAQPQPPVPRAHLLRERPVRPPRGGGWGKTAHLLTGALSASGRWRAALAESEEHLVASLHGVCERLGGATRRWRFDRMSTVCHPESGDLLASFAEVAKYYGVAVDVCPSRHVSPATLSEYVEADWRRSA
jgi:hypothetical protein